MRVNGQCHCVKIELEWTVYEGQCDGLPLCGLAGFLRQPTLTEQLFFAKVKTLKLKVKIGLKSTSRQRLKVEIKEYKYFIFLLLVYHLLA